MNSFDLLVFVFVLVATLSFIIWSFIFMLKQSSSSSFVWPQINWLLFIILLEHYTYFSVVFIFLADHFVNDPLGWHLFADTFMGRGWFPLLYLRVRLLRLVSHSRNKGVFYALRFFVFFDRGFLVVSVLLICLVTYAVYRIRRDRSSPDLHVFIFKVLVTLCLCLALLDTAEYLILDYTTPRKKKRG